MSIDTTPRAYATVTGTTATFTSPDGHSEPISAPPGGDIRHVVVQRAAAEAIRTGTPLELITSGDRGDHHLLVTATGDISPAPDRSTDTHREPVVNDIPGSSPVPPSAPAEPAAPTPPRRSFIDTTSPTAQAIGWRAIAARAGIRVPASAAQVLRREAVEWVSRHWAGCRLLAIVNGKGGIGKTMTTAMISAVFARHGGGNILAWDNNDTRGTLGWRTEYGLYDTTLRDLLPAATALLNPDATASDIARFVHHQTADRYDVLRSNPELLAADQRITTAEFDLLTRVAMHYYRLVIFDSGNDESADRWLRMIDSSHQLIIPTLPSADSAESAVLLLEALRNRDEHSAYLAENAVVVVTQPEPGSRREAERIAHEFASQVRAVGLIPFDPALKSGALRFDALRPRTRDAWTLVAANAAIGLD